MAMCSSSKIGIDGLDLFLKLVDRFEGGFSTRLELVLISQRGCPYASTRKIGRASCRCI